jgi:Na+/proline symporter
LATLGNLCQLSYFTRLFTARNPLDIKKCAFVGGAVTLIVCAFQFTIASGALLVAGADTLVDNELLFFGLADHAFGPWSMGVCAVIVVAAGMSLVSTVMSSHSVTISEIFIKGAKKERSEKERLKLIRITIVVYTLVALVIALMNLPNLYSIALCLFEGLLQFVPMMFFGCYWKRANLQGIASGFILSLVVTYGIYIFAGNSVLGYTGGVIGVLVNCACILIFGFAKPVDQRTKDLFKLADEYEIDYSEDIAV